MNYLHESTNKHRNFIFQHIRIYIRDCLLLYNSIPAIPANRIFVQSFGTQSGYALCLWYYQFANTFCR